MQPGCRNEILNTRCATGAIVCHNVSCPQEAWELHFGLCQASYDAERDADPSVVRGDRGAGVMNNQE